MLSSRKSWESNHYFLLGLFEKLESEIKSWSKKYTKIVVNNNSGLTSYSCKLQFYFPCDLHL